MNQMNSFLSCAVFVLGSASTSVSVASLSTCEELARSANTEATICRIAERGMASEVERRITEKPELLRTDCTREVTDLGHNFVRRDDLLTRVINVRFSTDWNDIVVYNKTRAIKSLCDSTASAIPGLDATILVLSSQVDPNEKLTLHKGPTDPSSDAAELCQTWSFAATQVVRAGFIDDAKILGQALSMMNKRGASTYPSYFPACSQL